MIIEFAILSGTAILYGGIKAIVSITNNCVTNFADIDCTPLELELKKLSVRKEKLEKQLDILRSNLSRKEYVSDCTALTAALADITKEYNYIVKIQKELLETNTKYTVQ